jgi:hypothetical protein
MSNVLALINRAAPLATAILLVVLLAAGGVDSHRHAGVEAYMASVRDAIEGVPHRIGAKVGTDVEPMPAAVRMLSPNKILQRRYLDPLTGTSLSLLIVHCGDVRDMLGHYPPVCYPSHGWQMGPRSAMPIEIAGRPELIMTYQMSRRDDLVEQQLTILNLFILPGQPARIAPDMNAVERLARTQAAAGLGVAQIQIVMEGSPGAEERERTARNVLSVLEPVVHAIGNGEGK